MRVVLQRPGRAPPDRGAASSAWESDFSLIVPLFYIVHAQAPAGNTHVSDILLASVRTVKLDPAHGDLESMVTGIGSAARARRRLPEAPSVNMIRTL